MAENPESAKTYTPEEIKVRKDNLNTFYKTSLPYLKTQLEYETLLTKVLEQQHLRYKMQAELARMHAPDPLEDKSAGKKPTEPKEEITNSETPEVK